MTESVLVRDLAVVLAIGAAVTALFHRARHPAATRARSRRSPSSV
jgi:hypothetical protein